MNAPVALLVGRDLKTLARDPLSLMLLFIPVVIGVVVRLLKLFLVPWLGERFGVNLSPWIPAVEAMILPMAPLMAGWCAGFLTLDEKDQSLSQVLQTVPVPPRTMQAVRLGWTAAASFVTGSVMMLAAGSEILRRPEAWLLLAVNILTAPPVALLLTRLGKNKVQGLTVAKALSLVTAAPLTWVLLSGGMRYAGGIIPLFWNSVAWMEVQGGSPAVPLMYAAAGVVLNGLSCFFMFRRFR